MANGDDSSTAVNESASIPAPAGNEAPTPDVRGDSSPAHSPETSGDKTPAESRKTLLDVVREAVPQKERAPGPDAERGRSAGASPAQGAQPGEDLGPLTQAEMDGVQPKTARRIAKLLEERHELRKQIPQLESQAQAANELRTFLKQAQVEKEEFGLVLDLTAAMKRGDFKSFLEGITPYVKLAQESLGIQLPQDLQQAVQGGHMTEAAARYVAQVRSQQQVAATQLNRVATENHQRQQAQQIEAFQATVASAVTEWEKGVQKSDPDYARKQPLIQSLLHAVVNERGPPQSPQDAVEIARQAYERATQMTGSFAQRPQATRQVPSSIANRLNGARPEPKTLHEAVRMSLERGR